MKAIVLAAGKGKRLSELIHDNRGNDGVPKVMREVGGKPMLLHVIENIGFIPQKNTAIVVGYKKEIVINGIRGEYLYPVQEKQLGTGDAVKSAGKIFTDFDPEEDVLICYGDMPLISRGTYESLISAHKEAGADCTVLTAVAPNVGLHYGRIIRQDGVFRGIVEYRDCTNEQKRISELNVGVYVFKMGKLFQMLELLETNNNQKEFLLTDIPKFMLAKKYGVNAFTINNSNEIYGINTPEEFVFVEEIIEHKNLSNTRHAQSRWFGTGGWRAIIGDEFTKHNVRRLSQAISDDMKSKSKHEIVIGYDRRFLSDKAAMWAAEVFAGNDITVYFITRIAPTPLVMYTVKQSKTYYGMAVTASHNPADYNGIKVFIEGGRDADVVVTDVFERIIKQGVTPRSISFDDGMANGRIRMIDPNNDYMDSIIGMIDMTAIRSGNLKVLLDPMFGVSKTTLQTILMTARCDVDIINDRHDTLFGGRLPSPTAETLTKLRDMVVQDKYDLGIGTDGDADRIGIIDSKGVFVHPNEILALLYYYLLHYKGWRGDVVRNIATTHILDKIAKDFGQSCYEVPVGFKHISSKMEQTDAVIGGESSGGLTIRGHIKGKDGIFASALIVEMMCKTKKTIPDLLEEIYSKYGKTVMAEFDARFSVQKKNQLWKQLFEDKLLPDYLYEIERVSYIDGCKIYFTNGGWIITRFSGTEPLLRIFCEMEDIETAEKCIGLMREFLEI